MTSHIKNPLPADETPDTKGGMSKAPLDALKTRHRSVNLWIQRILGHVMGRGGSGYRVRTAINKQYRGVVLDGPFAGMKYEARPGGNVPKMVGCYELELHPVIEKIVARQYASIVNVGCAEGYYAVGLAMRSPASRVYAYDIDAESRRLCEKLAVENECGERVCVRGRCDAGELVNVLTARPALVFCDCEGFELELLDPRQAPALKQCDILVELHDNFVPGLSEKLLPRFAATHEIEKTRSVPRRAGLRPELAMLSDRDQARALGEGRLGVMEWAWLRAKGE